MRVAVEAGRGKDAVGGPEGPGSPVKELEEGNEVYDCHCDVDELSREEGVESQVEAEENVGQDEKLIPEFRQRPQKFQEAVGDLDSHIGPILFVFSDQVGADLKIRKAGFLIFDDHLVEDPFEDDQEADGENGYHLQQEPTLVLLEGFTVAGRDRHQLELTISGLLLSHIMILIYKISSNPLPYSLNFRHTVLMA